MPRAVSPAAAGLPWSFVCHVSSFATSVMLPSDRDISCWTLWVPAQLSWLESVMPISSFCFFSAASRDFLRRASGDVSSRHSFVMLIQTGRALKKVECQVSGCAGAWRSVSVYRCDEWWPYQYIVITRPPNGSSECGRTVLKSCIGPAISQTTPSSSQRSVRAICATFC